jgi:hypothetical protein
MGPGAPAAYLALAAAFGGAAGGAIENEWKTQHKIPLSTPEDQKARSDFVMGLYNAPTKEIDDPKNPGKKITVRDIPMDYAARHATGLASMAQNTIDGFTQQSRDEERARKKGEKAASFAAILAQHHSLPAPSFNPFALIGSGYRAATQPAYGGGGVLGKMKKKKSVNIHSHDASPKAILRAFG